MKRTAIAELAKRLSLRGPAEARCGCFAAMVLLTALMLPITARADWLDELWSEESVRANGNPAITIRRDAVEVVLPAAVLRKAHDEGATLAQIINAFLDRYGPHCSDLLSFNLAHPDLKVQLSLQSQAPPESQLNDILRSPEESYLVPSVSNRARLFVVSPEHFDLTIDYVPTRKVHCIVPKDEAPMS
jgi:hypothetical protein